MTLTQCYMQTGDYSKALDTCEEGFSTTIKRNKGFLIPDFAHHKALCLANLGQSNDAISFLRQAYFGYSLLRRHTKAADLLQYANSEMGIQIETYGTDMLQLPLQEFRFVYDGVNACTSVGELIAAFRCDTGLTLEQLCEGICTKSTLNKIENGTIQGNVYILEALFEQLGRDINKYLNTFLSSDEFKNKQIRDEINALLSNWKYDKAEEMLKLLEHEKHYKERVGLQFIELSKATIYRFKANCDPSMRLEMLKNTLSITKKNFDLRYVATTRLTYYEILIINQIANILCNAEETRHRGMRLFEDLVESMNTFYTDETAKIRMYTTVLYNYSKFLGMAKRYNDALLVIDDGEELCLKHGQIKTLPGFIINRACILHEQGRNKESFPYFAQTFYCYALIGKLKNMEDIRSYVSKHFELDFD